mgnify:CR=1 FL=1
MRTTILTVMWQFVLPLVLPLSLGSLSSASPIPLDVHSSNPIQRREPQDTLSPLPSVRPGFDHSFDWGSPDAKQPPLVRSLLTSKLISLVLTNLSGLSMIETRRGGSDRPRDLLRNLLLRLLQVRSLPRSLLVPSSLVPLSSPA